MKQQLDFNKVYTSGAGAEAIILSYDPTNEKVLIKRFVSYQPFVVASYPEVNEENYLAWSHGHYFQDLSDALAFFKDLPLEQRLLQLRPFDNYDFQHYSASSFQQGRAYTQMFIEFLIVNLDFVREMDKEYEHSQKLLAFIEYLVDLTICIESENDWACNLLYCTIVDGIDSYVRRLSDEACNLYDINTEDGFNHDAEDYSDFLLRLPEVIKKHEDELKEFVDGYICDHINN